MAPKSASSALAGLLLLSAACSGGGSGSGEPDAMIAIDFFDARPRPDSAPRPDAEPVNACAEVTDFGDQGVIDGEVIHSAMGDGYLSIDNVLEAAPPADIFVVELFGGFAPFEDGIALGTYEITAEQTDYNTCGVCVSVFADNEDPGAMIYTAQSGTVVVTSIEGNFTGSFTPSGGGDSVTMQGYQLNETTEAFDRVEGCTITGGAASWDKAIPVAPEPPGPNPGVPEPA